MSTHLLPIYIKNAEYNIAKTSARFEAGNMAFDDGLAFCAQFRICAISWLLLAFDVPRFSQFLHMAASAFKHLLGATPVEDQVTSRSVPFFDAIASGDMACAGTIARSSRATCNPDYEYEDDFLYMRSVMKLATPGDVEDKLNPLFGRWEAFAAGKEDEKLQICKSSQAGGSGQFDSASADFLLREKEKIYRLLRADRLLPEQAATEGQISVEGLALLRIAELKGLAVEDEYMMVPSAIRNLNMADADPHDWRK